VNCDRMRILISAYIDGEVSHTERAEVEGHLRSCDECLNFHNTLLALKHLLASHRFPSPSRDGAAALIQLVRKTSRQQRCYGAHRCSGARQKMLELIDGKLSDDEAAMLLADIARCDTCTAEFAQWERYASAMAELVDVPIPQQRKAELIERLREEGFAKRTGFGHALLRLAAGALIACVAAMAIIALLARYQPERSRTAAYRERRVISSSPRAVKSAHGEMTKEGMTAATGTIDSSQSYKPQRVASIIGQPSSESRSRPLTEPRSTRGTMRVTTASAAGTPKSWEAKVERVKESIPVTAGIKRESLTVTAVTARPYKPVELKVYGGEPQEAQTLFSQRKDATVSEMPTVESYQFAVGARYQHGTQSEVAVASERLAAASFQKSLPKHGIGTATGEHVNDELYMHGGLGELLKHKRVARESTLTKLGEHSGQQWEILSGAAFQPRSEVEELERLRERMLGYESLVEQLRSNDAFMGANQNRILCLKLFRLGIKW